MVRCSGRSNVKLYRERANVKQTHLIPRIVCNLVSCQRAMRGKRASPSGAYLAPSARSDALFAAPLDTPEKKQADNSDKGSEEKQLPTDSQPIWSGSEARRDSEPTFCIMTCSALAHPILHTVLLT